MRRGELARHPPGAASASLPAGVAPRTLENLLDKAARLIAGSESAASKRGCLRKQRAAPRLADVFHRHIQQLARRGRLLPPDRAQLLTIERCGWPNEREPSRTATSAPE